MSNKPFDVIIWGASGFTGRLVVEYLLKQYGLDGDLRWAIAGRNQEKLEAVLSELGEQSIPIFLADSMDLESLNFLVRQTKVICTTVGPYAKYGSNLVEACVTNGVDYCDLTGEVQWIRRMIDQHHEQAIANGVKIVHCCGFDSIPSDMGVYFLQKEAKARRGAYCEQIKLRVKAMKGGFSGGTYASLNNVLAEAEKDNSIYQILENPYSLNPKGDPRGKDQPDLNAVAFDEDFDAWISPFVMASINTKIVRRSHALAGYPYSKSFQYDEATLNGKGRKGKMNARLMSTAMRILAGSKPNSLLKKIVNRFSPKPGEGPSLEQRENGFYSLVLFGKYEDGAAIWGKVKGDRDPGYGSTSKMLGESAVCLAKDRKDLPEIAGVITPSIAMGDHLLERLQANAGLTFEVSDKYST